MGRIEFEQCKLQEVMYVPELSTNLLSVNAIIKNAEVPFTNDKVIINCKSETKRKKTV